MLAAGGDAEGAALVGDEGAVRGVRGVGGEGRDMAERADALDDAEFFHEREYFRAAGGVEIERQHGAEIAFAQDAAAGDGMVRLVGEAG